MKEHVMRRVAGYKRRTTLFSFPRKTEKLAWSKECVASISSGSSGWMTYDCDTVDGSSGAPIIDAETLSILGVHNGAGSFFEFWNYGTVAAIIPFEIAGIDLENIQMPRTMKFHSWCSIK